MRWKLGKADDKADGYSMESVATGTGRLPSEIAEPGTGLFKEIICDETLGGTPLPRNLRVVAACNPYRLRTDATKDGASLRGGARMERESIGLTTSISEPIRVSSTISILLCELSFTQDG